MTSPSRWCPLVTLLLLPLVVMPVDVYVTEGKASILKCNEPADKNTAKFLYWDVVYAKSTDKTTELLYKGQDTGTAEVSDDGWSLYIESVIPAFYGTYRCAYNSSVGEVKFYTVQLMRTRTTTFEKFRLQIIVGLVASAAALIILGVICGVYNWRWENRHGQDAKSLVRGEEVHASASNSDRPVSFFNEGFTDEKGDITIISTHC